MKVEDMIVINYLRNPATKYHNITLVTELIHE